MADEDLDLDVKEGSKTNTILLIVLIVLLLLVGGGGAAFFLMGGKGDEGGEAAAEGAAPKIEASVAYYYEMRPEFIVNLESPRVNFMQLKLQLMANTEEVWKVVEYHMPVIRNNIMLILSSQKYEEINTREGKEKLREELRASIHEVIATESADANIENVYFTELVMQ